MSASRPALRSNSATPSADSSDWVAPRDRDRFADDTVPSAQDYFCDPTDVALENVSSLGELPGLLSL